MGGVYRVQQEIGRGDSDARVCGEGWKACLSQRQGDDSDACDVAFQAALGAQGEGGHS